MILYAEFSLSSSISFSIMSYCLISGCLDFLIVSAKNRAMQRCVIKPNHDCQVYGS